MKQMFSKQGKKVFNTRSVDMKAWKGKGYPVLSLAKAWEEKIDLKLRIWVEFGSVFENLGLQVSNLADYHNYPGNVIKLESFEPQFQSLGYGVYI